MGFGLKPGEIENALQQSPDALVDQLIDEAINLPLPPEPEWANWTTDDYDDFNEQRTQQLIEWITSWIEGLVENGFREKLSVFWHNHFVTNYESYLCPSYMYEYTTLLRQYALGNFKQFTEDIGKSSAMLLYLNGVQNVRTNPNENYARELFELFTLGADNGYTQSDIQQAARALTGWNGFSQDPYCEPITFVPFFHDGGIKTIFGQTGNWGYDDLHNILFEQRQDEIAEFICGKIYRAFVHPQEDPAIVAGLAQTFKDNNFELAPVFRQLFKSEHFFDEYNIGTQVKSPLELFLTMLREAGFSYTTDALQLLSYLSGDLGQQLLFPPDVAGWQGNRDWVDTSRITGRWQGIDFVIFSIFQNQPQELVDLARQLSNDSIDPYEVTAALIDHFIPNGLDTQEAYERATIEFKWEIPQNYFDSGEWNLYWNEAPIQVALLLRHISRLPEFQLT
jgi:uncharacterized protein (DUF1800 family)